MAMTTRIFTTLLLGLLAASTAQGKIFRNSYVSFELPPKWSCKIEGTEWVCNSSFRQQSREAVIILTAKEAGPSDNLSAYFRHLKQPRVLPTRSGTPSRSKVIHVKRRKIATVEWIDGLHNGSEIKNYYTRYLATQREGVAILVSFSGHIRHYTKYSQDFFRAINTLRVVADSSTIGKGRIPPVAQGTQGLGQPAAINPDAWDDDFGEESSGEDEQSSGTTGAALVVLAAATYYFLKKKKRKKRRR